MMIKKADPAVFVVATGLAFAAAPVGITIEWQGERADKSRVLVRIDPKYVRPTEVELLIGDPAKAKEKLGWVPKIPMQELCKEMVASDIALVEKGDLTS
ncbi:hypothetical protein EMIHUDRAFT_207491 [Emiliania huxleyi CCMP1516]|uniref:GDP-mannose 4,6-dehydratase n=2 Tax=Emiliania huxleyi TaxID=2903 RepID=A0A0D3JFL9_EMIH1|nr:hypothetical protein EMIHUDRAFT_207491 [Emiliania huxleyi CCMP1516]EOD22304.1 hypothetical protein EMIHUDRAFT_207491 [Emiliania huxleyi CCMP1516]|eukprot:XP_005774733.1 hypothetical protein EMIHUDRAFT_207491 [Emiliania huxleyi CCMP1516]